LEKRGVLVEVKKVMAISFIPIIAVLECESIPDIPLGVALAMGISVLDGAIVIPSIDMVAILCNPWPWNWIAEECR
jgi:hypothetical protein